jgi:competence protein ComGC
MVMKKGFTLIEMVVVVAVISALFLLTIPNVSRVLDLFLEKGCQAQLKVIDTALIEYRLAFDNEAESIDDLVEAELISESQTTCQSQMISIDDGKAVLDS